MPELSETGCLHAGKAENPAASLSWWLNAPGSPDLALKDWRISGELLVFSQRRWFLSALNGQCTHQQNRESGVTSLYLATQEGAVPSLVNPSRNCPHIPHRPVSRLPSDFLKLTIRISYHNSNCSWNLSGFEES